MLGWATCFQLGQVSPAYRALERHTSKWRCQWLCRKHEARVGKQVRFPVQTARTAVELKASAGTPSLRQVQRNQFTGNTGLRLE